MTSCSTCLNVGGISVFSGRHYTAKFTLRTPETSVLIDLTGALIWMTVKNTLDDLDESAILSKRNLAAGGDDTQILITDAEGGVLEVYILPDDTIGKDGNYWYDLVIQVGGKILQAVAPSQFNIKETVTNFDSI